MISFGVLICTLTIEKQIALNSSAYAHVITRKIYDVRMRLLRRSSANERERSSS